MFLITYQVVKGPYWVILLYGISHRNSCELAVAISSPRNMRIAEGSLSLMVIVVGNGIGDPSSSPLWSCLRFQFALMAFGNTWIYLFSLILRQTAFFCLGKSTSLGEGKLWIQTSCNPLKKLTLYCILPEEEGLGRYKHTTSCIWLYCTINKKWPLTWLIIECQ